MTKNLLLIDDDYRAVQAIQIKIKPLKMNVTVANDMETGIEILKSQSFDIALVDLRLIANPESINPTIDVGYATIKYLKENYPSLPIIAVTAGNSHDAAKAKVFSIGADDFWSKNISEVQDTLPTKIKNLIGTNTDK